MKTYTVQVEQVEDGWLCAQATNLRGAITQGRDLDEVAFMIRDAIELLTETKDFRITLRLDSGVRPRPQRPVRARRKRTTPRR